MSSDIQYCESNQKSTSSVSIPPQCNFIINISRNNLINLEKMLRIIVIFIICFVINNARSCDKDVTSTEEHAPNFTNRNLPVELNLWLGDPQTFFCLISGYPTPNYTWTKDGVDLNKPKSWDVFRLKFADEGNYTCEACNKLGCRSYSFVVRVEGEKLEFVEKLGGNVTAEIGSSHTFYCKHNQPSHKIIVEWYPHTKEKINFGDKPSDATYEPRSNVDTEMYKIENITKKDEGWYTCRVHDGLQIIESHTYLHVESRETNDITDPGYD